LLTDKNPHPCMPILSNTIFEISLKLHPFSYFLTNIPMDEHVLYTNHMLKRPMIKRAGAKWWPKHKIDESSFIFRFNIIRFSCTLKPNTYKFDKILDLRLLNSVICWAQILVDLARYQTQFPYALCISHIYPPSNLDKHYYAETSNTHSFSLRGPSAQMIVKIANLVLVLER